MLADYILGLSENPLILLFLINLLLFVVGMFLDAGPAIIILGPILGPIFVDLGVHPVHFAIIMAVNLTVGLADTTDGACAVRDLFGLGRAGRNHRPRHPAVPCRRGSRDLPDHLYPGHFHDDPAP